MTTERPRPLVAGNWKMNGLQASLKVAEAVRDGLDSALAQRIDVLICPPATLIGAMAASLKGSAVRIGGQDVHAEASGAYTGNVSAEMLADLGATATIVGHSERRAYHHESDADIRAKALAARRAGLVAIICVGETREEREAGRTLEIVRGQLAGSLPDGATAADTVIAYEPVWAIGTGLTPTVDDVAEVHALIRQELDARLGAEGAKVRILYGGSVKPSNAAELMGVANVDGALVGGASLKAEDFLGIAAAYR
ncbi:triose-phosphate isomerase [Methylobacterium frigidaeris]|uniref:Triosephosphate isomerase n=1 Tax=Methylobacterium frigidaeris TaxID=2038277 RepID=A0AA37M4T9_9HYPH|nr:triose-phosphate isomerase [Methylobacterium frigidaeris]PIK71451.1 triose-phosphate isomerase [Methylobacterium frigidaeris]GJD62590.1 Triosephosphate isomerase [Methylobacterium frigidaeris]